MENPVPRTPSKTIALRTPSTFDGPRTRDIVSASSVERVFVIRAWPFTRSCYTTTNEFKFIYLDTIYNAIVILNNRTALATPCGGSLFIRVSPDDFLWFLIENLHIIYCLKNQDNVSMIHYHIDVLFITLLCNQKSIFYGI